MRVLLVCISLVLVCAPLPSDAIAIALLPTAAIAFENDYAGCGSGAVSQAVVAEVLQRDGLWAPRPEGCVTADYFATGRSPGYLDALALRFEVASLSAGQRDQLRLLCYVRKGTYTNTDWHALRLYPGFQSTVDEDCDQSTACWTIGDEFPGAAGWEGWVVRSVPATWIVGDQLELTVRGWNVAIDAVLLESPDAPPSSSGQLLQAYAFEDDFQGCGTGPTSKVITNLVGVWDGVYAPVVEECVVADFFATGSSAGYLDALCARFDLSALGAEDPAAVITLHAYVRKGAYTVTSWHAVRLYPGLFNATDQDCDTPGVCWTAGDEFPGEDAWEGWIARSMPHEWVSTGLLDFTLRIWNARIDAIYVSVDRPTTTRRTTWGRLKLVGG